MHYVLFYCTLQMLYCIDTVLYSVLFVVVTCVELYCTRLCRCSAATGRWWHAKTYAGLSVTTVCMLRNSTMAHLLMIEKVGSSHFLHFTLHMHTLPTRGQCTGLLCSRTANSPIHLQLCVEGQQPHCDRPSSRIQEVAIPEDCPQPPAVIGAQPVVKGDWEAQGEA